MVVLAVVCVVASLGALGGLLVGRYRPDVEVDGGWFQIVNE